MNSLDLVEWPVIVLTDVGGVSLVVNGLAEVEDYSQWDRSVPQQASITSFRSNMTGFGKIQHFA